MKKNAPTCQMAGSSESYIGSKESPTSAILNSLHMVQPPFKYIPNLAQFCCHADGCRKLCSSNSFFCQAHASEAMKCKEPLCNQLNVDGTTHCALHNATVSCVNRQLCRFVSCDRAVRGNAEFCTYHGGGYPCEVPLCFRTSVSNLSVCILNGGGKKFQHVSGCTKAAQGQTTFCKAHGGGKRCQNDNCDRSAEGSTKLCVAHGGGRRCQEEGCTKSAQGRTTRCKSHGGGRRCQFENCDKSAQGSTNFCKAHGGGKRCLSAGCTKSARGKTDFCIGHGGGKRCNVEKCMKSAVGITDFCISHGGGRRCLALGCTKSARGGSDHCRAHNTLEKKKRKADDAPIAQVPNKKTVSHTDGFQLDHVPKDATSNLTEEVKKNVVRINILESQLVRQQKQLEQLLQLHVTSQRTISDQAVHAASAGLIRLPPNMPNIGAGSGSVLYAYAAMQAQANLNLFNDSLNLNDKLNFRQPSMTSTEIISSPESGSETRI